MLRPSDRKKRELNDATLRNIEKHVDYHVAQTYDGDVVHVPTTRSTWTRAEIDAVLSKYEESWSVDKSQRNYLVVLTPKATE